MATHLKPGDPAPEFSGTTTDGKPVSLKDYRGRKLVMYFYPMDDTPGCTKQACSLRDHNAEIAAKGAAILGVDISPFFAAEAIEHADLILGEDMIPASTAVAAEVSDSRVLPLSV